MFTYSPSTVHQDIGGRYNRFQHAMGWLLDFYVAR